MVQMFGRRVEAVQPKVQVKLSASCQAPTVAVHSEILVKGLVAKDIVHSEILVKESAG